MQLISGGAAKESLVSLKQVDVDIVHLSADHKHCN